MPIEVTPGRRPPRRVVGELEASVAAIVARRLCTPEAMDELVRAAKEGGVEVDVEEATTYLMEIAAALATPEEFAIAKAGIGGHELALIDFDLRAVAWLRRLGQAVAIPHRPDLRSALAVSGSAAQGRAQPFPADVDYFERLRIEAPSRDEALCRLAAVIRANALGVSWLVEGLTLREVHFGRGADGGVTWAPAEVETGRTAVGTGWLDWDEAARDPGFVKLDWWVAGHLPGGPGKASKVVDAIWDNPEGGIESLDGALDAEFQQVYLDPAGAQLAIDLAAVVTSAAERARYAAALEGEVRRYATATPPAFEKATKRLYNLCRLTGRYAEAVYLRELFDEPPARLHQAGAELELLAGGCEADVPGACRTLRALLDDLDELVGGDARCVDAAAVCRGLPAEASVEAFRLALAELDAAVAASASRGFETRLRAYPPVARLLDEIVERAE